MKLPIPDKLFTAEDILGFFGLPQEMYDRMIIEMKTKEMQLLIIQAIDKILNRHCS